jgi:hypothetical protein
MCKVIIAEHTSGSTLSGAPDLNAALHNLLGNDREADPVLSHVRAILAMNGVASQTW